MSQCNKINQMHNHQSLMKALNVAHLRNIKSAPALIPAGAIKVLQDHAPTLVLANVVYPMQAKASTKHWLDEYVHAFVRTSLTIGAVAIGLYPFELKRIKAHSPLQVSTAKISASFAERMKLHTKAFSMSLKGSAMRNPVLANRNAAHEKIENIFFAKDAQTHPKLREFLANITTAGLIGGIDAAFSNYSSVVRSAVVLQNPTLDLNYKISKKFLYEVSKFGFGPRMTRNSLNAYFCFGVTGHFKEGLDAVLPNNTYPLIKTNLAILLSGVFGGFCTNGFDVIHSNVVRKADFKALQAPSGREVAKELFKETPNFWVKGAKYTYIITPLAYYILHGVDYVTKNYIFPQDKNKDKQSLHKIGFFTKTASVLEIENSNHNLHKPK